MDNSDTTFFDTIDRICRQDRRYQAEAYLFVRDVLDYTVHQLDKTASADAERHVSGIELLEGFRELALQEFGPMTAKVMSRWGLKESFDVGQIVFNLVKAELLGTSPSDSPDDFRDQVSFHDAFVVPYLPAPVEADAAPEAS